MNQIDSSKAGKITCKGFEIPEILNSQSHNSTMESQDHGTWNAVLEYIYRPLQKTEKNDQSSKTAHFLTSEQLRVPAIMILHKRRPLLTCFSTPNQIDSSKGQKITCTSKNIGSTSTCALELSLKGFEILELLNSRSRNSTMGSQDHGTWNDGWQKRGNAFIGCKALSNNSIGMTSVVIIQQRGHGWWLGSFASLLWAKTQHKKKSSSVRLLPTTPDDTLFDPRWTPTTSEDALFDPIQQPQPSSL